MALSKKLSKPKIQENKIEELILKGGTSGAADQSEAENTIKRVQLRIASDKLDRIDSLVNRRIGSVSRHTWIMEAIEEKLGKETS